MKISINKLLLFAFLGGLALAGGLAFEFVQRHLSGALAQIQVPAVPYEPTPQNPVPEVPYVPTPNEVVEEMLKVANVGKDDIVYDLGCGDGRIVIAAAQKYGARGVGVDLSEERIKESNENARKAGVTERVKFLKQDLFETDLKDATVVTLYLLPFVNEKLRPKLFRELKPGTRVVSHAFNMGSWNPDKVLKVITDGNQERTVYFWVVTAADKNQQ
jgi:SAM-dependent methyltransferase